MGNETSKPSNSGGKETLLKKINSIASNYILTQNFTDMKNLADKKYCDKLIILTSKIIKSRLNNIEIKYLAQRLSHGTEVNRPETDKVVLLNKETVHDLDVHNSVQKRRMCVAIAKFYVQIAHLFAAIVKTINPVYTYKHTKSDGMEETSSVSLKDKNKIPKGAKVKIQPNNVCDNRIAALLGNKSHDDLFNDEDTVVFRPKVCNIQNGKSLMELPGFEELEKLYYTEYDYDFGGEKEKDKIPTETSYKVVDATADNAAKAPIDVEISRKAGISDIESESVSEAGSISITEPHGNPVSDTRVSDTIIKSNLSENNDAIQKEDSGLVQSYLTTAGKTIGNITDTANSFMKGAIQGIKQQNGGADPFYGMSERTREVYNNDLLQFYTGFTGASEIPIGSDGKPTIRRFKDIHISSWNDQPHCKEGGKYNDKYVISKTDDKYYLFKDYGKHIKDMIRRTNEKRDKLVEILSKLFLTTTSDDSAKKKSVVIHPDLNENSLKMHIDETRIIIIELYIMCEKDFKKGVDLLNAIIDEKKFQSSIETVETIKDVVNGFGVQDDMEDDMDETSEKEPDIRKERQPESRSIYENKDPC